MYAVWRACARLGIRPPGVPSSWDECGVVIQAHILAYDQIASHDELEQEAALAGAKL